MRTAGFGATSLFRALATRHVIPFGQSGDEEQKLRFKPGFVAGKEERFAGRFTGTVYNFEYVASGRNMSGRYYFLRANDTTIYVLRFAGRKDSLRAILNQTDSIARTFAVK